MTAVDMVQLLSTAGYQAPAPPFADFPTSCSTGIDLMETVERTLLHFHPFPPEVRCHRITPPVNKAFRYNIHFLTGSTFSM